MTAKPIDPLALSKALIACPSVTPVDEGALKTLQDALEPFGFAPNFLPFSAENEDDVNNLYTVSGKSGKNLCFAGHTDVVPEGNIDDWTVHPYKPEVIDGILYGRGTVDMKCAIACFAAAASEYIAENSGNISGKISFLITGDEEGPAVNGTRKMLAWLKEQRETINDCIVGEPTNPEALGDMIKIGRRGSITFYLTVEGTQGHVAYPHLACNPVPYLLDILQQVSNHVLDEGTDYFDPSNLEVTTIDVGNKADNVIPARAKATFNIRFNDHHTSEELIEWASSICSHVVAKNDAIDYILNTRLTGESFLTQPGELSSLVSNAVEKVTGRKPELSTTGGTSDARFIKDICPVVECGLINKTAHKVDEHIPVEDLYQLTKIYKEIITQYFA